MDIDARFGADHDVNFMIGAKTRGFRHGQQAEGRSGRVLDAGAGVQHHHAVVGAEPA
jgi:hypothetical protein